MTQMRAAMLRGPADLALITMDVPSPGPGQLLLRVEANAICGSDLKAFRGHFRRGTYPMVPGHEVAGRVVELGEGASATWLGQRVCVEPNSRCYTCRLCVRGLTNLCEDYHLLGESLEHQGGCAEYIAVDAAYAYALSEHLTGVEAALVQPLAIAYEGTVQRGKVAAGENVAIVGAGPIGLGAMMHAKLHGARTLVADRVPSRLAMARTMGADLVVRSDEDDLLAAVMDMTDGIGADLAVEAVGGTDPQSLRDAQRVTARRGRIVVIGGFADHEIPFAVTDLKVKEQTLIGSQGHPGTFQPVIDLITAGDLRPGPLISHRITLDELAGALDALDRRADGIMKIVVEPGRQLTPSSRPSAWATA